jgi:hypothetical protein
LPPDAVLVTLDAYELAWAESVGDHRHQESERRGSRQSDGSKDANALRNHRQGAAAELALTKFLGIPWNATVNTFNGFPDLDGYLECRSKQDRQAYMRLYPNRDSSKETAVFVSVTSLDADFIQFRIDGWCIGSAAMQTEYMQKNRWNKREWQVPLSALQPAATLGAELQARMKIIYKGRTKMRAWVQETMKKAGLL